jgi:hypothetical protein
MVLVVFACATGCANRAWKSALAEDSAVGYHQFLREHPDSKQVAAAHERVDFLKLRRSPTLASFEAFRAKYPESQLVGRLQAQLETATFKATRAAGTPEAYASFASAFPDSPDVARAEGNAVYLAELANHADAERLARFAVEHPESDFADEARLSAEVFNGRREQDIARVGLVVDVSAGTADARRVVQRFVERAKRTYSRVGSSLLPLASAASAATAGVDAVLTIRYREQTVDNVMQEGLLAQPGVLATTRVSLRADGQPIWDRTFELRVERRQVVAGRALLFGSGGPRFWNGFFVPVATWQANLAVREPVTLSRDAVAVDASGDRAVVLFENGGFEVLQLADPAAPVKLLGYERRSQLEHFSGVRVVPGGVAIFGDDGLELVGVAPDGRQTVRTLSRGEVGSINALELAGDELLIGGTKGLLSLPVDAAGATGEAQRVMRRVIRGMARSGDTIVLADGDMLFISTLPLLREKRVLGQMRVGKAFATRSIRLFGTTALVIGDGGVIVLDVRDPRTPRMIGRLRPDDVGKIEDAARVGTRVFLAGERGIQVLGPRLDRVVDVVDAIPARQIASFGRHLVAVGGDTLQVVDGMPFGPATQMPAKPAVRGR